MPPPSASWSRTARPSASWSAGEDVPGARRRRRLPRHDDVSRRLLRPEECRAILLHRLDAVNVGNGFGMTVRCAASELPDYGGGLAARSPPGDAAALPHPGVSAGRLRRLRRRAARRDKPPVLAMTFSALDDTLAPPGKHVVQLWSQYFPYTRRDGRSWDDTREDVADTHLRDAVRLRPQHARRARDSASSRPRWTWSARWACWAATSCTWRCRWTRCSRSAPCPNSPNTRRPIPGLFLTGASTHPGGGVFGASGLSAARVVGAGPAEAPRPNGHLLIHVYRGRRCGYTRGVPVVSQSYVAPATAEPALRRTSRAAEWPPPCPPLPPSRPPQVRALPVRVTDEMFRPLLRAAPPSASPLLAPDTRYLLVNPALAAAPRLLPGGTVRGHGARPCASRTTGRRSRRPSAACSPASHRARRWNTASSTRTAAPSGCTRWRQVLRLRPRRAAAVPASASPRTSRNSRQAEEARARGRGPVPRHLRPGRRPRHAHDARRPLPAGQPGRLRAAGLQRVGAGRPGAGRPCWTRRTCPPIASRCAGSSTERRPRSRPSCATSARTGGR